MITIRVPLRVSLFGGGTDLPNFFRSYGGTVSGFTINRYIYLFASKIDIEQGFKFRFSYKKNEDVRAIDDISHPIFREALRSYNFDEKYHFTTMSCLPSGAGLGSSSSFTVGFLFLLNQILGHEISSMDLAKKAIHIEREILAESGGWQDQLHPSFGGFNTFDFDTSGNIIRTPVDIDSHTLNDLNNNMYLLYSGKMRQAKAIENSKTKSLNYDLLKQTYDLAKYSESLLRSNNCDLPSIGRALNEGWHLKRGMSGKVSNSNLDDLYDLIIKSGAYGAKLCGAGGGGFFMVLASDKAIKALSRSLPHSTISRIKVDFKGLVRIDI